MTAAIIGFVIMMALMLMGMPIAFAMLFVGFVGYGLVAGFSAAFGILGMVPYSNVATYTLCVVPMFTLMGEFAYHSGIVAELYEACYKWFGHYRSGLCTATIIACAGFGATTGSSTAGSSLMTQVAYPEMKSRGYSDELALGCIASGGNLGILIPPSTPLIVFGSITSASIGKLFLGGVMPGLLMAFLFCLTAYIVAVIKKAAPAGPKATWEERFESLRGVWAMLLLIAVVMGGLWGGLFTPSEAAGIGSFGALVISVAKRRMSFKTLVEALMNTLKITAMIFALLIGAAVFTKFIAATHMPTILAKWVIAAGMPKFLILFAMLIVYIILGMLMDTLSMTLLTVPIFAPIIIGMGFDLVWFGIMVVIMTALGNITPPVGMNVFVVSGMVKEVPMTTVFKGILPFVFAMLATALLVYIFPQIALWLPSLI